MPFAWLGTSSTSRSKPWIVVMIRAMPRIGDSGGSSGCIASFTPASSATGTTRSRKYRRVSQSCSSVTVPALVGGAERNTSWSYAVTSAPPRPGVATEVRSHPRIAIQL